MNNAPPQVPTMSDDAPPAPPRNRGRPPRKGRAFVKLSINVDEDLYTAIQSISEHTSIPVSRVINTILRAYQEADYTALDFQTMAPYSLITLRRWPQQPEEWPKPYSIQADAEAVNSNEDNKE